MHNRDDKHDARRARTGIFRANKKPKASAAEPPARTVPEIYEVVIACRHEAEQRAVFERMRGEGYRCRVMTL